MFQPVWLAEKLSVMLVDQDLVTWITDYLMDRLQYKNCSVTVFVHSLHL